jgi:glycosyltransferase involved in cell wall biosynthesis
MGLNISDKNKWRDASHPMKVMDYSALGLKVVSTDLIEVRALDLPNIFLFSEDDYRYGLLPTLRKALNVETSYDASAKFVIDNYNWNDLTNNLLALFKSVLSDNRLPRIVHVSSSYPPKLGGLQKVVENLATAQKKKGLEVSVITSNQGMKKNIKDKINVKRCRSFVIANTTIIPGMFLSLMHIKRNSIIHLHITQAYNPEIVWIASKLKGFHYIAQIHLDVPPSGTAGLLLKIYKPIVLKRVLRSANYVIVFSKDQKRDVHRQYGIPIDKLKVISNGVEKKFYNDQLRFLHQEIRLLFVGRLSFQKNLEQLFYALDGITIKYKLNIVGDGEYENNLKKIVKDLKLKKVNFLGRADNKKLLDFYREADIFVLPSEREGMPLVLLESMAMGLPIIATDVTGNRELVKDGENGKLVPYSDEKALRDALIYISNNKGLYDKLSRNSRKLAESYTWDNIADKFERLYEQIYENI